jgi:quinol monooxygenase YgiN
MANIQSTDFLCTLHVQIKPNDSSAASKLTTDIFKRLCHQTASEQGCLLYSFTYRQSSTSGDDQLFVCREIYKDGPAILAHLDNVGSLLKEMTEIATFPQFEVHGPREELEAIQELLPEGAQLWFVVENTGGFLKKGFY